MHKNILNCKSKQLFKTFLPCKIKNSYDEDYLIGRIKFKKYNNDILNVKIKDIQEQNINVISGNVYSSSIFKFKIKHDISLYKIKEYNITNKAIIEDIDIFVKLTKQYIELYMNKEEVMFRDIDEIIFIILKQYENNITSLQQYRSFKLTDIFTKDFLFKIKYM